MNEREYANVNDHLNVKNSKIGFLKATGRCNKNNRP